MPASNENPQHRSTLDFIHAISPDLIFLAEVTPAWAKGLKELRRDYPFSHLVLRYDSFGIALWSRLPFTRVETMVFGDAGVPSVVARIGIGRAWFTFIGTHPLPPISAAHAAMRNRQLALLAEFAASLPGPVALAGDLNLTPWSPYFRDFLARSSLKDSRPGPPCSRSWPFQSTTASCRGRSWCSRAGWGRTLAPIIIRFSSILNSPGTEGGSGNPSR